LSDQAVRETVFARLGRYARGGDPLSDAANTVALVIAGNQPFYPIYLFAIAGDRGWPSLLTWFSTPLFLAVPAVARRSSLAGRALLCVAGLGNTAISNLALGGASGIPLFYLPCLILCLALFARGERLVQAGLVTGTLAMTLALGHIPALLGSFSAAEIHSLQRVHVFSVGCLTLFLALLLTRAYRRLAAS
jgi:hypothetical protein